VPPRPFRLTAPEPYEQDIHEAAAKALDALLLPPAIWFAMPVGHVKLSAAETARLSRIGLKRGLPDLWILYHGVFCFELKKRGGRLSKTRVARTRRGAPRVLVGQEEVFPQLIASGGVASIAVAHSVDEMLAQIRRWGLPLRDHRLVA
jgi:hypothetical protein